MPNTSRLTHSLAPLLLPVLLLLTLPAQSTGQSLSLQGAQKRPQAYPDFPYQVPGPWQNQPYTVEISFSGARPAPRNLYGFNQNLAAVPFKFGDSFYRDMMADLAPGVLRFPGGTIGNWFDPATDRFSNLGKPSATGIPVGWPLWTECNITWPGYVPLGQQHDAWAVPWMCGTMYKFHEMINQPANQAILGASYGQADFVSMVIEQGHQPVYMANVLTKPPSWAAAWVAGLDAAGGDARYVELGNENHFPVQGFAEITSTYFDQDGANYLAHVQPYDTAVKAAGGPALQTAVNIPGVDWTDLSGVATPDDPWTESVWNISKGGAQWFDDIVVHQYGLPGGWPSSNKQLVERLLTPEVIVDDLVSGFNELFNPGFIATGDPGDITTNLWVTEWNAMSNATSYPQFGSVAHGLFLAGFQLRLFAHHDTIEIAAKHHSISSYGAYAPYIPGSTVSANERPLDGFVPAEFPFWWLIGKATRDADLLRSSTITPHSAPGWAFEYAQVQVFSGANNRAWILLVNKLPIARPVELTLDPGGPWGPTGVRYSRGFDPAISPLQSPASSAAWGLDIEGPLPFGGHSGQDLVVPPYSVNVIEVTLPWPQVKHH